MKATGIVRRIDDLGRVVIPKEIRRTLRLREGDPLEIFTDRDGGVVFKKYSQLGDLSDCSGHLCDTLSRVAGLPAVITDRDFCIAAGGLPRRELAERRISFAVEQLMEARRSIRPDSGSIPLLESDGTYRVLAAAPVLSEGDVLGCVLFVSADAAAQAGDTELKLAQAAAGFLGKHMES